MNYPQPNNPLQGITLKDILITLIERYQREGLADRIPVNCFAFNPTISSSLNFLRKTPRARSLLEKLYIEDLKK